MRERGRASCTGTWTRCPRAMGDILTKEGTEWCFKDPIQKEDSDDCMEGTELISPLLVNGEKIFASS